MEITILGSGNVGSTLGKRWAAQGHQVTYGSRDPSSAKVQALVQASGGKIRATSPQAAVAGASIVLLAIPFHAAKEMLGSLGALDGKILIDATNPLGEGMKLTTWPDSSASEQIAGWAKGAQVVKAFNVTGSGNMADTNYKSAKPAMFVCGDSAQAKKTVSQLADEIGFDPVDCGPLHSAAKLEALGGLWVSLAYVQGLGPNTAFALLRR